MEILRRSQMAGNEAEKFKGIVRFSELAEGMLYAPIHPTHHVLPLIVRHFQKRLSCEEWAIHDVAGMWLLIMMGSGLRLFVWKV